MNLHSLKPCGRTLLAFCVGASLALSTLPAARAADLDLTPAKRARVHAHHHHKRVLLRDYDGTSIVLSRYRPFHPVDPYFLSATVPPAHAKACGTYPVQQTGRLPYIARTGACCPTASNSHRYPYALAY